MLRIIQVEEFQGLLLQLPALVDRVEAGGREMLDDVGSWLRRVETALGNNRLPLAGEIASFRTQRTLGRRGVLIDGLSLRGTPTLRKIREVMASDVVRRVGPVLTGAIAGDLARIEEADRLARQLITAAQLKGFIPAATDPVSRNDSVRAVWNVILSDPEIGAGAMHMLSILGPEDSVIILDRAITRDIWRVTPP